MHNLKFILDADMPRSSAEVIRNLGFDVEDVRDIGMRAAKDREIIEYALRNNRIIITKDTDFGEVLRYPKHPGAVIFRLPYGFTIKEINKRLEEFFKSVEEDVHSVTNLSLFAYLISGTNTGNKTAHNTSAVTASMNVMSNYII